MIGLVALLRRAWRMIQDTQIAPAEPALRLALCLAGAGVVVATPGANAVPAVDQVRGFFCNAKNDSIDFLMYQAKGENEEMAANAVNKSIAKFSCAYYLPADLHGGAHGDARRAGLQAAQLERWSGSVLGSLQQSPTAKHDV